MDRLSEAVLRGTFPLFGLRHDRWDGRALVHAVGRGAESSSVVHTVQLLYFDPGTDGTVFISNINARVALGDDPTGVDRMHLHLEEFARGKGARPVRRWLPWAPAIRARDFSMSEELVMIAGRERAVYRLKHDRLPLEVMDGAVREGDGITDLVVAGWGISVRSLMRQLEPITMDFAREFDAAMIS